MPRFILICASVWPQYTNVTDRTNRQDSMRQTVLQGERFYKRTHKNRSAFGKDRDKNNSGTFFRTRCRGPYFARKLMFLNFNYCSISASFFFGYQLHFVINNHVSNTSHLSSLYALVMAALWNRAGHYIFMLWFLSSIFYLLFSSPNLSAAVGDWTSTILRHMVWP